jgi:hypothetical protein
MDILGDDDVRWSLHDHHDPPFPRDICTHHFIEKEAKAVQGRSGRKQELVRRT